MTPANSQKQAFIAPFAVFLLMLCAGDLLGAGAKYWLYPLQTLVSGAVVIWFWPAYSFRAPVRVGFTIVIAVIVLLAWISPQELFHAPRRVAGGFDPTVPGGNTSLYYAGLTMRFLRLVVIVPFIEEIFWRGFLLRYLIRDDFASLPFGSFTWLSFGAVTAGFCIEHHAVDWPAAILAGALYNLVAYRTRSLASCVLAHAVTNLLLGIYIMRTGQWGFW
jgi:CAAX prenyl protease-like protein